MDSWEGQFSWQAHALSGRPDFLNYLNAGDVTWEDLWAFYRQQRASAAAVRALMRLFHLFLSSEYDAAGCWLDPDSEIRARLEHWAEFALDSSDRVPLSDIRADLAGLVGSGLVTSLYYEAAYLVFMEVSVDRAASSWSEAASDRLMVAAEFPERHERILPVYHPGSGRFPHLAGDVRWHTALRSHVAAQYRAWNGAYAAHLPDPDEEEVWTTVGGEA
jgi:hypothetical protein